LLAQEAKLKTVPTGGLGASLDGPHAYHYLFSLLVPLPADSDKNTGPNGEVSMF
jgi:hypothetical protein